MTEIKNLLRDELIGLNIEIIDSKNPTDIGSAGEIIDETKHTITIIKDMQKKRYWKNNITIKTTYQGKTATVKCNLLVGRPHERIKTR